MAARLKWFASCPSMGLMLRGPYPTQAAAYAASRMTPEAQAEHGLIWPKDLVIWPDDRPASKITETPTQRTKRKLDRETKTMISGVLEDLRQGTP